MHLEGVIFCQWWAQCHEWMAQMLQCICFPSQLKQTVSFLLGCLALAADDGNYTVLPFPVVYTQLAMYASHPSWHGTAVCPCRIHLDSITQSLALPPPPLPFKNQNEMFWSLTTSSKQTAEGFSCS